MATLEVHDGEGGVERVTISRDQTVLFGSSPKCDVVLSGDGIFPFHGRLRWDPKKQRFKVDASPDARFLVVNGHRMSSSSFRLGDEIVVGRNRVFLINDGENAMAAPPVADDPTRVQAPPLGAGARGPAPARAPIGPSTAAPPRRESRPAAVQAALEEDLEAVVSELEAPHVADVDDDRGARRRGGPAGPRRGWKWLSARFSDRTNVPGRETVVSSPLAFGLLATFIFLVLIGLALYGIIVRTAATRLYNRAVEDLEDGDYRTAVRRFDAFLSANRDDPRAGPARVHRAMANVRQYTTGAGASWSMALEAERRMLDTVGKEPAFRDSSTELAEQVLTTGENLAERARLTADPKLLAEAESTVALHGQVAGQSAEAFFKRSRLPDRLEAARAAVRKAGIRTRALAAMDEALKAGSFGGVHEARDGLVAAYADLADDPDLLSRMTAANELIRRAVKFDPSGRPAETGPRVGPLGRPSVLVLRAGLGDDPPRPAGPSGPVVFGLADGLAYGLDAEGGAPLWQVAVGPSAPYPPQPIAGTGSVLVFDARHDELVRLEARTGALEWRQSLGEPAADPPLVLGNQLVQATPSGKLRLIDLATGALQGSLELGLPLSGTPVTDEAGQVLYVTARKDCLFVVRRDPLGCVAVEYLGHAAGAIACPPARLGRYLVVAENHRFDSGRWRVFVLTEDATRMTEVQQVPIEGWTWSTPASAGAVIWAAGDRGGVAAYALGAYTQKQPFRPIARVTAGAVPSGPAFALARSERELWLASGRSGRYELDPEASKLTTAWTLGDAGPAAAPPVAVGGQLVLTQQYTDGPGVALWGVDPRTGQPTWRTVLGAGWTSPPVVASGGQALSTLGADGTAITLSAASLRQGGFVTARLPRPGGPQLPGGVLERIEGDGWTARVPAAGAGVVLVREGGPGPFREVRMPAPVGARPVAWGREMLLPAADGRAYLVDPLTGQSRAEPYVPPFDRSKPTRWVAAVSCGPDAMALADDEGRVRRLVRVTDPRPRLVVTAEHALGKELVGDPASTASAFVAVTADGRVRVLAARDLGPIGAWPLEAPLALPPAAVAGRVFVADAAGGLLALGPDGQHLWSVKPSGGPAVAGPPAVRGDLVWVLGRDGSLRGLSLADGAERARADLHTLPAGGVVALGDDLLVPVGRGALSPLSLDQIGPSSGAPPVSKP